MTPAPPVVDVETTIALPGVSVVVFNNATVGGLLRAAFSCALGTPARYITILSATEVGGTIGSATNMAAANAANAAVTCRAAARRQVRGELHQNGATDTRRLQAGSAPGDDVGAVAAFAAEAAGTSTSSNVSMRITFAACDAVGAASVACMDTANATAMQLDGLLVALRLRRGALYAGLAAFSSAVGLDVATIVAVARPVIVAGAAAGPPAVQSPAQLELVVIVGIAVGLAAALCLVLMVIVVVHRRRRRQREAPVADFQHMSPRSHEQEHGQLSSHYYVQPFGATAETAHAAAALPRQNAVLARSMSRYRAPNTLHGRDKYASNGGPPPTTDRKQGIANYIYDSSGDDSRRVGGMAVLNESTSTSSGVRTAAERRAARLAASPSSRARGRGIHGSRTPDVGAACTTSVAVYSAADHPLQQQTSLWSPQAAAAASAAASAATTSKFGAPGRRSVSQNGRMSVTGEAAAWRAQAAALRAHAATFEASVSQSHAAVTGYVPNMRRDVSPAPTRSTRAESGSGTSTAAALSTRRASITALDMFGPRAGIEPQRGSVQHSRRRPSSVAQPVVRGDALGRRTGSGDDGAAAARRRGATRRTSSGTIETCEW